MDPLPIPPGPVAEEVTCHVLLNGTEVASLWCSPMNLDDLALGFLISSRIIPGPASVSSIEAEPRKGAEPQAQGEWVVRVAADTGAPAAAGAEAGGGRAGVGARPGKPSDFSISLGALRQAAKEIMEEGPVRLKTGGVHSAGAILPTGETILREDVSRHCALDKVVAAVARAMENTGGGLFARVAFLSSGRAASELVQKMVNLGVPVFATRGIPTTSSYRLAHFSGITLVGQILSPKPVAYSGAHRVYE